MATPLASTQLAPQSLEDVHVVEQLLLPPPPGGPPGGAQTPKAPQLDMAPPASVQGVPQSRDVVHTLVQAVPPLPLSQGICAVPHVLALPVSSMQNFPQTIVGVQIAEHCSHVPQSRHVIGLPPSLQILAQLDVGVQTVEQS